MRKFYIIFNDEKVFEGQIDCKDKDFIEKIIYPLGDSVYSWYIWPENEEKLTEDNLQLLWT